MSNPPSSNSSNEQSKRFADLARELECDEDEAAFDAKLREVAKHKPLPETDPNATTLSGIPEGERP